MIRLQITEEVFLNRKRDNREMTQYSKFTLHHFRLI